MLLLPKLIYLEYPKPSCSTNALIICVCSVESPGITILAWEVNAFQGLANMCSCPKLLFWECWGFIVRGVD